MNHALASLFDFNDGQQDPVYTEHSRKQLVYDALKKLAGPCGVTEIVKETGLTIHQVRYALRFMLAHRQVSRKEVARGAGRTFLYSVPIRREGGTQLEQAIAEIEKQNVPLSVLEISVATGIREENVRTTLMRALKLNSVPGLGRTKANGPWKYYKEKA